MESDILLVPSFPVNERAYLFNPELRLATIHPGLNVIKLFTNVFYEFL
jgi:hypothetical protein